MITAKDVSTIYEVPIALRAEGLDSVILKYLHLPPSEYACSAWEELVDRIKNPEDELTIHVVGKYTGYEDSYRVAQRGAVSRRLRQPRANQHPVGRIGSARAGRRRAAAGRRDGILVPGGFGSRGTRGMMKASEYARQHAIPFFGICYGFQWATVEYARNVCGLDGADSTEVDEAAPHKVIYKLRDLLGVDELGGTMRLGRYACQLRRVRSRARSTAPT